MTPEDRKDCRAYAWGYFAVHADQRMKLFNFFLIFSGLFLSALSGVRAMAPQSRIVSLLPLGLVLASFIFWRLDERTRQLIRNAEAALKFLDLEWPVSSHNDGSPHFLQIVERDEYLRAKAPRRWWNRALPMSYTASFRMTYIIVGGIGVALALWLWLG
jgi:hypothetical protein